MTVTGGPTPIGPSAFTPDFELQTRYLSRRRCFLGPWETSFEIGVEFRRLQSPLANGFFERPGLEFPELREFHRGPADFDPALPITLLGALPGLANSYRNFRESDLFPYIQDTWKVSRTVTLNLGLRFDFISNPIEAHNLLCAFIDPSSPSTTGCARSVSHVSVESVGEKS